MTGPEPEPIAAKATARRMPTGTAAHTTAATLCLVLVMLPASAHALDADAPAALLQLINSHRVVAQRCNGVSLAAREPLRAVPVLAAAPARPAGPGRGGLNASLRAAGYAPARSLAIDLSGPRDAGAAMRLLVARHCAALSSALYSDIGLARNTDRWRVVLAEPLLSPTLGTAAEAGPRVLQLVNAARAVPRRCGPTAPARRAAPGLERAAGCRVLAAQPRHGRSRHLVARWRRRQPRWSARAAPGPGLALGR